MGERENLFRERNPETQHPVTFIELFFDLVFVFAVTQLSHGLIDHFTPLGVVHVLLLMAAVWWVWMFTSYITNWLDPELPSVRLMMLVLMLAGLALSTSILDAFGSRGWVVGLAYPGMQVGRSLFMLRAIPHENHGLRRNFRRVCTWFSVAAVFWLAGGASEPGARVWLWGVAIAVEYLGPALRFWSPWLGASNDADWAIEGGHLSERSALFIIIALGESILVTGATFAESDWNNDRVAAFAVAFVGSVAMWWIYFDTGAESGTKRILQVDQPGRLARLAYLYVHLPLVAGIILTAVGDEFLLKDPLADTKLEALLGLVGGPMVYLTGALLFKKIVRGQFQTSHVTGLVVLCAVLAFGSALSRLSLAALVAGVLALVAARETNALRTEEEHQDLSSAL